MLLEKHNNSNSANLLSHDNEQRNLMINNNPHMNRVPGDDKIQDKIHKEQIILNNVPDDIST